MGLTRRVVAADGVIGQHRGVVRGSVTLILPPPDHHFQRLVVRRGLTPFWRMIELWLVVERINQLCDLLQRVFEVPLAPSYITVV